MGERLPVLYLAPWVGYGGSDKNTIDWFRWLDRDRFAPALITTQPSPNPLLSEVEPFAEEIWVLPDLMAANEMPGFITEFVVSRGVQAIHLMNSKLGFDLLPELAALPERPAVVVQMHAEEANRSGYVRHVSTRYADLVDCFSLSNEHVADAVRSYGVAEAKIRVIYTGADTDGEFAPDRAEPVERFPAEQLQILFAARLVDQKDPLLMVEVAAALQREGVDFQIHVVGEGDLEERIEARIAELGLGDRVILHGPTAGLVSWYAACDVLLLTSTFEGVPVVIFEAMSMGLPIVTPGLPAIRELLGHEEEGVVLPRDSVAGYVEPLARLARDRAHLAARGQEMRARAREQFSVQQMAAAHGELYEELAAGRGPARPVRASAEALPIVELGADGDVAALSAGLAAAPGPLVALASKESALRDADPHLDEKVLQRFAAGGEGVDAIALADAGADGRFSFRALSLDDSPADLTPHTLIWRRDFERRLPQGLQVDPLAPVASLADLFSTAGAQVEWRHLPAPDEAAEPVAPAEWVAVNATPPAPSSLPEDRPTWVPPRSSLAIRCRQPGGGWLVAAGQAPPGAEREHVLGALRDAGYTGTLKLIRHGAGYSALAPEQWGEEPDGSVEIGYLEAAPLPGLDLLAAARHRESGEIVLVSLADDPLLPEVEVGEHLGFLDPYPLRPRETPRAERSQGLLGLVKSIDAAARRHCCAIGSLPGGEVAEELGALSSSDLGGTIPAWIVDGRLITDRHTPPTQRPRAAAALGWVVEPLGWTGLAPAKDRLRVTVRRSAQALGRLLRRARPTSAPAGEPEGWLFDWEGPGMTPLFAAYHPVTGDQLLSRDPQSAAHLGYGPSHPVGFLRATAPLTGELGERPLPIPWARRFGHVPRPG